MNRGCCRKSLGTSALESRLVSEMKTFECTRVSKRSFGACSTSHNPARAGIWTSNPLIYRSLSTWPQAVLRLLSRYRTNNPSLLWQKWQLCADSIHFRTIVFTNMEERAWILDREEQRWEAVGRRKSDDSKENKLWFRTTRSNEVSVKTV